MSPTKKDKDKETHLVPGDPASTVQSNLYRPATLTASEAQEWQRVLKTIEENRWIVPAVITAGAAGALEILHLIFLAVRFVFHVIQGTWTF